MTLATQVIEASKPFLGIATKDLLSRVATKWLGIELESIQSDQIQSLAYWVKIAALKLMTEEQANELAAAIQAVNSKG